jgi:hypothetical protein
MFRSDSYKTLASFWLKSRAKLIKELTEAEEPRELYRLQGELARLAIVEATPAEIDIWLEKYEHEAQVEADLKKAKEEHARAYI